MNVKLRLDLLYSQNTKDSHYTVLVTLILENIKLDKKRHEEVVDLNHNNQTVCESVCWVVCEIK